MTQNIVILEKTYDQMLPEIFQGIFLNGFDTQEKDIAKKIKVDFERSSFVSFKSTMEVIRNHCLSNIPDDTSSEEYQKIPNFTQGDLDARLFQGCVEISLHLNSSGLVKPVKCVSLSYYDTDTKVLAAINISIFQDENNQHIWCISHLKNIRAPFNERQWLILYSADLVSSISETPEQPSFLNLSNLKKLQPTIDSSQILDTLRTHIAHEGIIKLIEPIFNIENTPLDELAKLEQRIIHKQNLDKRDLKIKLIEDIFRYFPHEDSQNDTFARTQSEVDYFYEEILSSPQTTQTFLTNIKKIYKDLGELPQINNLKYLIHLKLAYIIFSDSDKPYLKTILDKLNSLATTEIKEKLPLDFDLIHQTHVNIQTLVDSFNESLDNTLNIHKIFPQFTPQIPTDDYKLDLAQYFFTERQKYANKITENFNLQFQKLKLIEHEFKRLINFIIQNREYFTEISLDEKKLYIETVQKINLSYQTYQQSLLALYKTKLTNNEFKNSIYLDHIQHFELKIAVQDQVRHWKAYFQTAKTSIFKKNRNFSSLVENHKLNCEEFSKEILKLKKLSKEIIDKYLTANLTLGYPTQDINTALEDFKKFEKELDEELHYYAAENLEKSYLKIKTETLSKEELLEGLEPQFERWNQVIIYLSQERNKKLKTIKEIQSLETLKEFFNILEFYQTQWLNLIDEINSTCFRFTTKFQHLGALNEKLQAYQTKINQLLINNLSENSRLLDIYSEPFLKRNLFEILLLVISLTLASLAIVFLSAIPLYVALIACSLFAISMELNIKNNETALNIDQKQRLPVIYKFKSGFFQSQSLTDSDLTPKPIL